MIRICPLLKEKNFPLFNDILQTGFNAVRFNFSHLSPEVADEYKNYIRTKNQTCKIVQDLQGHKIRIGNIYNTLHIQKNTNFIFTPSNYRSDNYKTVLQIPLAFENYNLLTGTKKFVIENKNGPADIIVEKEIIENGNILFKCIAKNDIVLRKEKGVNAIGFDRTNLPLSIKDKKDLLWGLNNKADVIIYSFASSANQIIELKEYIKSIGEYMPNIWAKIESEEGIQNIDEILNECDGVMIGRGDMCVEVNIKNIPKIQNEIIQKCKLNNKECIIATYLYDNYRNKESENISDITALYYLYNSGATGFMPANEIIFSNNPYKISKNFNDFLNSVEED